MSRAHRETFGCITSTVGQHKNFFGAWHERYAAGGYVVFTGICRVGPNSMFATQKLTPVLGATCVVSAAASPCVAHSRWGLAAGNCLAAIMEILLINSSANLITLVFVFIPRRRFVSIEEIVDDSLCADLVPEEQHGMAFGMLATVDAVGDFLSRIVVGTL